MHCFCSSNRSKRTSSAIVFNEEILIISEISSSNRKTLQKIIGQHQVVGGLPENFGDDFVTGPAKSVLDDLDEG